MNSVSLLGRLVRDPEFKYSGNGEAYCRFTIAVNRKRNREEVDYFNCIAFRKRSEAIAEYVRKGMRILVEGRLQSGSYEKNGEKIYKTEVIVETFDFIDYVKDESVIEEDRSNYDSIALEDNKNTEESDDDFDFPF